MANLPIDLNRWCKTVHGPNATAVVQTPTVYGWVCRVNGTDFPIDVLAAAKLEYGPNVTVAFSDANNPYSWFATQQSVSHQPPSTNQLNRVGQAIVQALGQTFTLIPIGDEGGITADDVHFDASNNTIHFHVTIHYKQSGPPGFLGQITGPLYDFQTFYQGDIDITNPQTSIENTQYGFDINVPTIGTEHVALNAGQLVSLGQTIALILA